MNLLRGPGFFVALLAGFLLALFSPLIVMRSTTWLAVIVPALALWVLWLMRVYQRWGREGLRPWEKVAREPRAGAEKG